MKHASDNRISVFYINYNHNRKGINKMKKYRIVENNFNILKDNLTLKDAEIWLSRFLYLGYDAYIIEKE